MAPTRPIDVDELSQYFCMPEKAVAKHLGICLTSLKKICRNNGIHRWPYRKVKSMDKKLRKLEASGRNADAASVATTDDGTLDGLSDEVLCALGSQADSPISGEFDSGSETGEATASSATTPRGLEFSASVVSSPVEDAVSEFGDMHAISSQSITVTPSTRSAFKAVPVKLSKSTDGQPIKLELSLPPNMLQQMANGAQNITFTIQGVDSDGTHVHLSSESIQTAASSEEPRLTEIAAAAATAPAENADAENMGMTDDDIIAMLAGCAAPCRPRQESFAEVVRDKSAAAAEPGPAPVMDGSCLEPSDAELMAALASCCGGQNPFNPGFGGEEEGGGEDLYHGVDAMTWNGESMEDILGEHA